jgi:lipopolysaccharide export system permease protein
MRITSVYLVRNVFLGFLAAAALLLPLFTTFDLVTELDDVSADGYRWPQAIQVVLMTLPRRAIDLGPFIALLGGITGLGQLAMTQELTAMRTAGISIIQIALTTMLAGVALAVLLGAIDEWVASPLQQKSLQIKNEAFLASGATAIDTGTIWARRGDEVARVGALSPRDNQPVNIEVFRYAPNLLLESYIFARSADVRSDGTWLLNDVRIKEWHGTTETFRQVEQMPWHSMFSDRRLKELTLPTESFSIEQLHRYIQFLQGSNQPSAEYEVAFWQKLGRPILTLAMILFAVPFTFAQQRSPGLGGRLALGALIGLLIYVSNQIIVSLGLLLASDTMLTTLMPSLVLLGIALILVLRFDRSG